MGLASLALPFVASAQCYLNDQEVPCEQLKGAFGWIAGIGLLFGLIVLVTTLFWLWMLVHAATKPIENKVVWIILMVVFGPLVSLIYYFMVKRKFSEPSAPQVPPVGPTVPPMQQ